ncbi:methyl-accepting chemotaxis protein [Gorillibacterium sp. sgz5001074]|uniref:methyl-accepting chemotaxis protein n=1 Tax=Gorillibacterium sp. sgz5001074 TaxID=3446695 RepID=UPI003F68117E
MSMKITIGRKLVGAFMAVALLTAAVSGLSFNSLRNINKSFEDLVEVRVQVLSHVERVQVAGLEQNDYMREYFLTQNPAAVQRMQTSNKKIIDLIEEVLPSVEKEEDKASFKKVIELAKEYKTRVDSIMILPHEQALREASLSLFPLATQISVLAEEMANDHLKRMGEEQKAVQDSANRDQTTSMVVSFIIVALAIGIGILCSLLISRPLRQITAAAKQIAAGDLTVGKLGVRTKDEIGDLAGTFEAMVQQLRSIIGKVERSAGKMAESSRLLTESSELTSQGTSMISDVSQEVATGAEQQVRGAEDSARAMEEMTAGIGRIAESSASVYEQSVTARAQADEGDRAAQRAVEQMNVIYQAAEQSAERVRKLHEHSTEIGEIIQVITDIATQTSLLALNASIEAARAGEQGRGFMVVATEVKKLAIQSETAAKQITDLIHVVQRDTSSAVKGMNEGMQQSQEGLQVVQAAGLAFTRIREAIEHVASQIEEVSATSEEISAGSEEVAASVEETARIARLSADKVQTVAATSQEQLAAIQEIASSAATLNSMAEELQQEVSRFKL